MSILLVLVAHDGRTLQLDVQGATRVDAVQQALVSFTGITVSDQIVMCHGARLDPAKPLAAYKLPVVNPAAAADQPVFLYHKAYLRPGAAPPPAEPLPVLEVTVPGLPSVGLRHPLQSAHSPLIRALPDYEAQFMQQLGEARAFWEASQLRLHKCRQLMSEQEVQARAADAARANVESHYNYIAAMYSTFVDKYVTQHRHHSKLLSQFANLSAALATVELPPQLATGSWRVLADLQPNRARLTEWHDSCNRSHEHFAQKVAELENVFQLLRTEVERLFLQAPSVDLDALGLQLNEAERLIDEQGSIVQVLSKDLLTVKQLVEDVVAQLGGSAGGASLSGAAVHDACAAVDTMHDNHLQSLLPRVRAADASAMEFLLRCADAKARMTRDVLEQLQGIAAQQSRIRDMKHKLAVFNEVLTRQAAAFNELQTATRLPAAYRLALAECARRAAWQEMFAGQATRLAEHCGRITAKEAAKRESIRKQLEKHLPIELLAKAGLLQDPPHCTVSAPPGDAFLLPVTPADISRLPAVIHQAAEAAAAAAAAASSGVRQQAVKDVGSSAAAPGAAAGGHQASTPQAVTGSSRGTAGASLAFTAAAAGGVSMLASTAWGLPGRADAAAAPGGTDMGVPGATGTGPGSNLALENARLRAELAAVLAQQAAKELGAEAASAVGGSSVAVSSTGVGSASVLESSHASHGAASISLAASAATGAGSSAAAAAATSSAGGGNAAKPYGHGGAPVLPASIAAPLPDVSAAVQQAMQMEDEHAAAVAAQQALMLAPVQAALAAKDELVACLDARCSALTAEVASFEARITQLEEQLAGQTSSSSSRTSQQQQQQQTRGDVQQQQELPRGPAEQWDARTAGSSGAGVSHSPYNMVQSVAPAFALDTSQNPSCFAAGGGGLAASIMSPRPPSMPAAALAGASIQQQQPGVPREQQQKLVTPREEEEQQQQQTVIAPAEPAELVLLPSVIQSIAGEDVGIVTAAASAAVPGARQHQADAAPLATQIGMGAASAAPVAQQQQQSSTVKAPSVTQRSIKTSRPPAGPEDEQGACKDTQPLHASATIPAGDSSSSSQSASQQQPPSVVETAAAVASDATAAASVPLSVKTGPSLDERSSAAGPANADPAGVCASGVDVAAAESGGDVAVAESGVAVAAAENGGDVPAAGVSLIEAPAAGGTAAAPSDARGTAQTGATASHAVMAAALSVSEPDLRTVAAAHPVQGEEQQQQQQPARCTSVDSAAAELAGVRQRARGSRRSVDGAMPSASTPPAAAAAGGTGITSLLSSSMHYLFHRSSSKGDSSSSKGGSTGSSSAAVSPPMSPPAIAAAAAAEQQSLHGSSANSITE